MPDETPTVATLVMPELHVPPAGASVSAVVLPWHTVVLPDIAGGRIFTVTVAVVLHPAVVVYLIVAFPGIPACTVPFAGSIVATLLLLLLHVPPVVASLKIVVMPAHNILLPVIGIIGFTVTVVVTKQPEGIV